MIIVCDNTNIAELFFRKISGEDEVEIVEENGGNRGRRKRKAPGQSTDRGGVSRSAIQRTRPDANPAD